MPRAAFLAFLLTPALLAQAPPGKHPITLDDLAKLQTVGKPEISPDGAWVAYTVRRVDVEEDKNVSDLWMVSWDGTQDVQLTYTSEGASNPQWSPDGHYLSFVSDRPGKAKGGQLWVMDRRGGEARQLTNVKEALNDYRWSPDSKQLLLTLTPKDEPEDEKKPAKQKPIVTDRYQFKQDVEGYLTDKHPHLFLFSVADAKLTRLLAKEDDQLEEHDAEWSPDGKRIAFTRRGDLPDPFRTANSDVYVADAVPGSVPRKLTTFKGPDEGKLAWSPDSARIAYRQSLFEGFSEYNEPQLAVVPAAGGKPELLTSKLDRPVAPPVWTADGSALLTTVTDDRDAYAARVSLTGQVQRLTQGPGDAAALTSRAGHTALLYSTNAKISELYALDGAMLRTLTHHNDALLATLELAPTNDFSAKTKDGNEVHALLTLPPVPEPNAVKPDAVKADSAEPTTAKSAAGKPDSAKPDTVRLAGSNPGAPKPDAGKPAGAKPPLLLWIHGGPTAQDAHTFDLSRQVFAAHGYAVLQVNYRGSSGRGFAYSNAIAGDWGNKEVQDLLAAVDAAVATGEVDPGRLAVGGWSYGGILTDYLVAATTRFRAASSGAGMGNLLGLYGVDQYVLQYTNELGAPWRNPERYIRLSYPFFHADRIKTPTLFMGGDRDFNVPVEGGEQMYQALRDAGTPAELVVYPGQNHGFTRPSFVRDRYLQWFGWYDKYLGFTPAAAKP